MIMCTWMYLGCPLHVLGPVGSLIRGLLIPRIAFQTKWSWLKVHATPQLAGWNKITLSPILVQGNARALPASSKNESVNYDGFEFCDPIRLLPLRFYDTLTKVYIRTEISDESSKFVEKATKRLLSFSFVIGTSPIKHQLSNCKILNTLDRNHRI